MDAAQLHDAAHCATIPWNRLLGETFNGILPGGTVVVLGAGPSAREYKRAEGDYVIACNGAIAQCPDADVWIVAELEALDAPWFPGHADYAGVPVWAVDLALCGREYCEKMIALYPGEFLERVVWYYRRMLESPAGPAIAQFDIRKHTHGLVYIDAPEGSEVRGGSVSLNGYQLAAIMGAAKVETYGCEFSYPDGEQHADGWSPDIAPQTFTTPDGKTYSGSAMLNAHAAAFRQAVQMCAPGGPTLVDHSGGLLQPAPVKEKVKRGK